MSLSEKWEENRREFEKRYPKVNPTSFMLARMREAFYAGAQADCHEESLSVPLKDRLAEIDHFRSHK